MPIYTYTGRCKFPLLNGRVLKDESEEMKDEEDKEVIAWCVSFLYDVSKRDQMGFDTYVY